MNKAILACTIAFNMAHVALADVNIKSIPLTTFGEVKSIIYSNNQLFILAQPYAQHLSQIHKIDIVSGMVTNSSYLKTEADSCSALNPILKLDSNKSKLFFGGEVYLSYAIYEKELDLNLNIVSQKPSQVPINDSTPRIIENKSNGSSIVEGSLKETALKISGYQENQLWPYFFRIHPTVYRVSNNEYVVMYMKNGKTCGSDGNECQDADLVASLIDINNGKLISQKIKQGYAYGEKGQPNEIPVFTVKSDKETEFKFALVPLQPYCRSASYEFIKL